MIIDLFENESIRARCFDIGVKEFKAACKCIRYAHNMLRSMSKYDGLQYSESVEPILSLIEKIKPVADRLYTLRKISSNKGIREALEGFNSKFIQSRFEDNDIVRMESSTESLRNSLNDAIRHLENAKRAFQSGMHPDVDDVINGCGNIVTHIREEYAV